jgi:hypothetical protein
MPGTLRDYVVIAAVATGGFWYDQRERVRDADDEAGSSEARNVILVVSDGLRWQEVFRGADSLLVFGDASAMGGDGEATKSRFWRSTIAERREVLMPFVWKIIAREGQILGNRDVGSAVRVTNGMNFSYPGYNEMLVGYPDRHIDRNDYGPNPNVTVFEWLNRRREFRGRVAAVGAWSTFADIFNYRRSRIQLHASREEPLDGRAHAAAMRFLSEGHHRALFVAYVETDDWAHDGNYDRYLNAAHAVDAYLAALWSFVQSHPQYRGRTTLIFTTDHGRGAARDDWTDHGEDVRGSDEIWVALLGPETPAQGEARNVTNVTEGQTAATVAAALGLDYRRDTPAAAKPIHAAARH